jgi:aminoglycoside phosphotransferase (APT) family kinase protein
VTATAIGLDPALPQLEIALDHARIGTHLERDVYGDPVDVLAATLVRHKPGRRCTVRYELELGARRDRVYGKFFASDRAPRVFGSLQALASARACAPVAAVPEPVGHSPELRLVVQREAPGTHAVHALLAGDVALASRLAEALRSLHTSDVVLARSHETADELRPLAARVAQLAVAGPSLAPQAQRCLTLAAGALERCRRWRRRPLHRDFYHDQALVHTDGLVLIDFDDAAMGEPSVDVANFIAHLRLLALEHPERRGALAAVAEVFARRYAELDDRLDAELVELLEAATLLRLACIHLPRAGEGLAGALLETSERTLISIDQRGR